MGHNLNAEGTKLFLEGEGRYLAMKVGQQLPHYIQWNISRKWSHYPAYHIKATILCNNIGGDDVSLRGEAETQSNA